MLYKTALDAVVAARNGDYSLLNAINPRELTVSGLYYYTTVHVAAAQGTLQVLRHVVETQEGDVNVKDQVSVLYCSVFQRESIDFDILKYLLPKCDPGVVNDVLMNIATWERPDDTLVRVARLLVKHGADLDTRQRSARDLWDNTRRSARELFALRGVFFD